MYRLLLVDEDRKSRQELHYLLEQTEKEYQVQEVSSGKEALEILSRQAADIMITQIRLSEMDGLELIRQARQIAPDMAIMVICSYTDFALAQRAKQYGVEEYVLTPVDQNEFVTALNQTQARVEFGHEREKIEISKDRFLHRHFLQQYLYSGSREVLERASQRIDLEKWNAWHCAILVEAEQPFFDDGKDFFWEEIETQLRRPFFHLNLNSFQTILFFTEVYCDYTLVAKSLHVYLKQAFIERFYLAVSSQFDSCQALPEVFHSLLSQMDDRFCHPDQRIFTSDEDKERYVSEETQDSLMVQLISEDISRKDIGRLKGHFGTLQDKYIKQTQFSAMYVKFVFSRVIQELFQDKHFTQGRGLEQEIDRLYACSDLGQILEITRQCILEYEIYLEQSIRESARDVEAVRVYIGNHLDEALSLEELASKSRFSPGDLSFLFKNKTGIDINRYVWVRRMEEAARLLGRTCQRIPWISSQIGFSHLSYFRKSFRIYYGLDPEEYRSQTLQG